MIVVLMFYLFGLNVPCGNQCVIHTKEHKFDVAENKIWSCLFFASTPYNDIHIPTKVYSVLPEQVGKFTYVYCDFITSLGFTNIQICRS